MLLTAAHLRTWAQALFPLALTTLTLGQANGMLRHGPRGRPALRVPELGTDPPLRQHPQAATA